VSFARRRDGAVVDVAVTPVVVPAQHRAAATATATGDLVTLEVHSLGGGRNAIAELDAALATARSAHQLIVDLRGVRGGVDRVGYRLVGGLAEGKPVMGTARVLLADQTRAARKMWRDLPAEADGWSKPITLTEDGQAAGAGFHGKIAAVVDATCASTCEVVAAALRWNLHAVVFGETTAGNSGAPIELTLPGGGDITVPTWTLTSADGKPIEDDGVVPDVAAPPTVDTLAAGSDAAMDAARRYCTSQ
jgi:C-terminal processing protease CtpA/Prc